jgi:acyl carrier protein
MTRDDLTARVFAIVAERVNVDDAAVVSHARLMDDLGADSVDMVEILMDLQDAFGIDIPDAEVERLDRVGAIVDYLAAKLGL